MTGLLAGLTVCLLVSLLLMTVADGLRRGHPHLPAFLSLTVGGLWDREPWLHIHAGKAGGELAFKKWRWRSMHHQIRWIRLDSGGRSLHQDGDTDISGIGFQGSVSSREQCAHLGSFVPKTS